MPPAAELDAEPIAVPIIDAAMRSTPAPTSISSVFESMPVRVCGKRSEARAEVAACWLCWLLLLRTRLRDLAYELAIGREDGEEEVERRVLLRLVDLRVGDLVRRGRRGEALRDNDLSERRVRRTLGDSRGRLEHAVRALEDGDDVARWRLVRQLDRHHARRGRDREERGARLVGDGRLRNRRHHLRLFARDEELHRRLRDVGLVQARRREALHIGERRLLELLGGGVEAENPGTRREQRTMSIKRERGATVCKLFEPRVSQMGR